MSDRMIGFLAVVCLFAMLLAAFPFYVYNKNFRRCVALENGLNLGYNAVFDLSLPYFLPKVVVKFPNGAPLVNHDLAPVFISSTTVYGQAGPEWSSTNFSARWRAETGLSDYAVAWRADTGLVFRELHPELFKRLVAEAGDTNVGIGMGSYNARFVFFELAARPEHGEHWCRTRLVTW